MAKNRKDLAFIQDMSTSYPCFVKWTRPTLTRKGKGKKRDATILGHACGTGGRGRESPQEVLWGEIS